MLIKNLIEFFTPGLGPAHSLSVVPRPEILRHFLLQLLRINPRNLIKRLHEHCRIFFDGAVRRRIHENIAQVIKVVDLDWVASARQKEIF